MLARLGELSGSATSQVAKTDVKTGVSPTVVDDANKADAPGTEGEKGSDKKPTDGDGKAIPLATHIKLRTEMATKLREAKREAAHEKAAAQQATQLLAGEIDRLKKLIAAGGKLDPVAEELRVAQLQLRIPEIEAGIAAELDAADAKEVEAEEQQSHAAVVADVRSELSAAVKAHSYVQYDELKTACMEEFKAARAEKRQAVPFVVTAARLQKAKIDKLLAEHKVTPAAAGNSPERRPLPQTSRGTIGQAAQTRHPSTPEGMLARFNELLAGG
jgi:hypothetical protein